MKTYEPDEIIGMRLKHPTEGWYFVPEQYESECEYRGSLFGNLGHAQCCEIKCYVFGDLTGGNEWLDPYTWILIGKGEPPYQDDTLECLFASMDAELAALDVLFKAAGV